MGEKKTQMTDSGGEKAFPLLSEFMQMGGLVTRTQDVPISAAGWYRFAIIKNSTTLTPYLQGIVMWGGGFGGYETSMAMIAWQVIYGGAKLSPIVSSAKSSPTKIRIVRSPNGYPSNTIAIDLYFARTGNNAIYFSVISPGADLILLDPIAVADAPSGEIIAAEYTFITTPPTPALPATTTASGIADLAGLKAQMKTWIDDMGANSTGFFTATLTNTISPISGIRLMIQINYSNLVNYGSAIITTYKNSKGCNMYLMSYYNGAWTDPATVTAT